MNKMLINGLTVLEFSNDTDVSGFIERVKSDYLAQDLTFNYPEFTFEYPEITEIRYFIINSKKWTIC